MPSVKIIDLAEAFMNINGRDIDDIKIIGENPGEKMHEDLLNNEERRLLLHNDKMFVRMPIYSSDNDFKTLIEKGFSKTKMTSFCSDNKKIILDINEVTKILKRNSMN